MQDCDKMDMKLRQFLLVILDDLSDLDRCRLHFVLGKHIPRRLRELNTIQNTIQVFEHLIDNGKIFSCLIEALSACGKTEWSEKLKEFERTYNIPLINIIQQSQTKTQTHSILDEILDEEEDFSIS